MTDKPTETLEERVDRLYRYLNMDNGSMNLENIDERLVELETGVHNLELRVTRLDKGKYPVDTVFPVKKQKKSWLPW
jgi:hypothetical protein